MDKEASNTVTFTVAEARDRFAELVERAVKGETVVIARDGRPLLELRPVPNPVEPPRVTQEDLEWLKARRVGRTMREDAGTFVSRMRDEDWER